MPLETSWAPYTHRSGRPNPAGVKRSPHRSAVRRFVSKVESRESPPSVHRPRTSTRSSGRARTSVDQPALVMGQTRRRICSRRSIPNCGSRWDAIRWRCSGRSARSGWTSWPSDESFVRRLDELAADLDNYLTRPLWYQERGRRGRAVAERHRILLDGVRRCRGAAELFRWPGHSGRRSPEVRLGSGPAADRGGAVVPLGILPAVADRRRLAARELPVAGSAGPAAAAADRQRQATRCWWSWRCRTPPSCGRGSGSRRWAEFRCCCWIPTSRRTSTSCAASPTGSTAATRNTGSSRRSWPASAACGRSARSPKSRACPRPRCST